MTLLNPVPQNVPENIRSDFMRRLVSSVFTIFSAVGGKDGVPRLFRAEGTPSSDPGWSTSSTVNMTPPDGYLEVYNKDGDLVEIPYWNK